MGKGTCKKFVQNADILLLLENKCPVGVGTVFFLNQREREREGERRQRERERERERDGRARKRGRERE